MRTFAILLLLASACVTDVELQLSDDDGYEPAQSIGPLRWARTFGGAGVDYAATVTWDGDGSLLVSGAFSDGADLGAGTLATAHRAMGFAARYAAADGSLAWSLPFDGSASYDIEVMDSGSAAAGAWPAPGGGALVAGSFTRIIDWGAGPIESGLCTDDAFLAAYDAAGALVSSRILAATGQVRLVPLADGGAFVAGRELVSDCDWLLQQENPQLAAVHATFLARHDAAGNLLWRRDLGPEVWIMDMALMPDGGLAVTGAYHGTVDIGGQTLTSNVPVDNTEGFAARVDAGGAGLWARRFAAPPEAGQARPGAVAADDGGRIWVGGDFGGEVDFGSGPRMTESVHDPDLFLLAIDAGGDVAGFIQSGTTSAYGSAIDTRGDEIAVAGISLGRDLAGNPVSITGPLAGRYATDGVLLGSQVFPATGPGHGWAWALAFGPGGEIALSGSFTGTIDLGDGPRASATTEPDAFVAVFDAPE